MRHLALGLLLILIVTSTAAQDINLGELTPIGNAYPEDIAPLTRIGRGWGRDAAWSPDGETLAAATSIGVWLYDPDDLDAAPRLLDAATESVAALAYSADGHLLAIGGKTIQLWDVEANQLLRTLPADGSVLSLAFSPDGTMLVSSNQFGAQRYSVSLWDVETGAETQALGHSVVDSLTFSPDGALIAGVALGDGGFALMLWDADSGENVFLQGFSPAPDRVLFSPDGTKLTVILRTGSILFLDPQDPYANGDYIVVGEGDNTDDWYPPGAGYTPDGERLVALSGLGNLRVWDTETLEMVSDVALDWEAHRRTQPGWSAPRRRQRRGRHPHLGSAIGRAGG